MWHSHKSEMVFTHFQHNVPQHSINAGVCMIPKNKRQIWKVERLSIDFFAGSFVGFFAITFCQMRTLKLPEAKINQSINWNVWIEILLPGRTFCQTPGKCSSSSLSRQNPFFPWFQICALLDCGSTCRSCSPYCRVVSSKTRLLIHNAKYFYMRCYK